MRREDIVGKRFLSVSGFIKPKQSKVSEWGWRAGVIRASSHKDNQHPDLQILVEFDDVEWQRREWISIHKSGMFHAFLVEDDLVWTDRPDASNSKSSHVFWPALGFTPLVDTVDMKSQLQPVELLADRELAFRDVTRIEPFLGLEQKAGAVISPEVAAAVRKWQEVQDGQRILLSTPSVLVGYRVEVYRAEGTTQWYTAVIIAYNQVTRDLTVTDDTVLEEHNEDPALVQMRLIGDGVVESIMRGEVVGSTPRRSRSAAVLVHNNPLQAVRVSRACTNRQQPPAAVKRLKPKSGAVAESGGASVSAVSPTPRNTTLPPPPTVSPPAPVLAALPAPASDPDTGPPANPSNTEACAKDHQNKPPSVQPTKVRTYVKGRNQTTEPVTAVNDEKPVVNAASARSESETAPAPVPGAHDEVVSAPPPPHDDADRMEETGGTTRFSDDRSDSGVSSLRSCSGDERSGSRSSALSSSDEPTPQRINTRSPLCGEQVRVWRDPSLTAEPRVRHVHSVQHQTLLMSQPQVSSAQQPSSSASCAPPGVSAQAMVLAQSHYQPPPPLLTSPHHNHMLAPPALYGDILQWKQRFAPVTVPSHLLCSSSADEMLREERERVYVQDRDRMIRREQEREIEKHKERERLDREKMERERERLERERKDREERDRKEQQRVTELAVHQHFEESLRLAAQNKKWPVNIINQLPISREEERKRTDDLQQRLLDRHRHDQRYYPPRPPSNPPPAHTRTGKRTMVKAEPSFNMFGYPGYAIRPEQKPLPAPPPLSVDLKSSVIVKNDGKGVHHVDPKLPAHSPKIHKFDFRVMDQQYRPPPPTHGAIHPRAAYPAKPATVNSYPYPVPPVRCKVSSPAPSHMYGKPTAGITSGLPVVRAPDLHMHNSVKLSLPATPSPYQPVAVHQPPTTSSHQPPSGPPPPAHSSKPALHPHLHSSSPTLAVAPRNPPVFQTQPLDLGLSERSGSPKRRAPTPVETDLSKRPRQSPPVASPVQPLLTRVSEPSPLVAGAATTITTVVNTAAFVPELTPSPIASPGLRVISSPRASPGPRSSPNPARASPCARASPGVSPGPAVPGTSFMTDAIRSPIPRMPVHKKKAWIHSYTQDGGVSDTFGAIPVTEPSALRTQTPPSQPMSTLVLPNAVNSVCKTPVKGARKTTKDVLNGHTDTKSESSCSDPDARKSPAKRKAKVKKKKKVGKTPSDDSPGPQNKKKKTTQGAALASAQTVGTDSSESERETGSEKDSDSGCSKRSGNNKEPKKRGRRPKSSKNDGEEEPRVKRGKEEPAKLARDPFPKPPVAVLKKTGESFLQDGACFEVAPKLGKCRECRWTPNQRSKTMPNIFCRFYAFRRLRYTKNGQLAIAGFSHPMEDPTEADLKLWLPTPDRKPELVSEMCKFILKHIGDQCCYLLQQEKDAINVSISEEKTIAWKRVVQGVREMCDVCETTLFNFHWACGKCGFVVCIDCYKTRKSGIPEQFVEVARDRDKFAWLQCTNRQSHELEKLMLTQIIAGDSMTTVNRDLHKLRASIGIEQKCDCLLAKEFAPNGVSKDLLRGVIKTEGLNGLRPSVEEEKENNLKGNATTNGSTIKTEVNQLSPPWQGDEDKKPELGDITGDGEVDKDGNFSTLRELLIRPASLSGEGSAPSSPQSPARKIKTESADEVQCECVKGEEMEVQKGSTQKGWWGEQKPRCSIAHTESHKLYPNVQHSWLCEGNKLLRLLDPNSPHNLAIFKDQWGRGQPVLVSDVSKSLDQQLWQPSAFIADFGEEKNDLVNCLNGKIVPNQPMRKFWEGFEYLNKRLKDERGNPMLLKLKDWPPTEDFAEMLPERFSNLMAALPLPQYTHRTGQFNLACRLPDCFVRPDLGPKMYNAYGSAIRADKATTNLHLDVSDAVNVMVHISIPKDTNYEDQVRDSFQAIDDAGCDLNTRRRVREKKELAGALWHIYNAHDTETIRTFINKVKKERGVRTMPNHDPIHDQDYYLDNKMRARLKEECGVQGYTIVQCLGDAVFIPAGAPHQVRNLHSCIKIAQDFVSVENVAHCFNITQELRNLSSAHLNREDKLQIKNIMYHSIKDSLSVIMDELRRNSACAPVAVKALNPPSPSPS